LNPPPSLSLPFCSFLGEESSLQQPPLLCANVPPAFFLSAPTFLCFFLSARTFLCFLPPGPQTTDDRRQTTDEEEEEEEDDDGEEEEEEEEEDDDGEEEEEEDQEEKHRGRKSRFPFLGRVHTVSGQNRLHGPHASLLQLLICASALHTSFFCSAAASALLCSALCIKTSSGFM
jgi:hypothetical protein